MRRDRLPVEGDDERAMVLEFEPEDACRCSVDQTQPNPLAGPNPEPIGYAAIDRDRVADSARHADFHRVVEATRDGGVVLQAKVAEHPDDIAIDRQGLGLIDDQRAHQAPPDLLGAVRMRVVPVGAGIRHGELIDEALLRLDRWLGHVGRTVHRVRNTQAMPVDRGVLSQPVLDTDPQRVALAQPDLRPGHIAP